MKFELMISSDEDGFRWISHDIEKDWLEALTGVWDAEGIGLSVIAKMKDSRERASRPVPPPPPPSERDLARIAAKGHDCFLDENEVLVYHGDAYYTYCRLCGETISAG